MFFDYSSIYFRLNRVSKRKEMHLSNVKWRSLVKGFFLIIIIIPVIMWLVWRSLPEKDINIFVVDKTSHSRKAMERYSLFWVMHYNKFSNFGKLPSVQHDYYGFYPEANQKYKIRDLASLASDSITTLAEKYNIL